MWIYFFEDSISQKSFHNNSRGLISKIKNLVPVKQTKQTFDNTFSNGSFSESSQKL